MHFRGSEDVKPFVRLSQFRFWGYILGTQGFVVEFFKSQWKLLCKSE